MFFYEKVRNIGKVFFFFFCRTEWTLNQETEKIVKKQRQNIILGGFLYFTMYTSVLSLSQIPHLALILIWKNSKFCR